MAETPSTLRFCARPESATADSGRAKSPEGVRFAAAPLRVHMNDGGNRGLTVADGCGWTLEILAFSVLAVPVVERLAETRDHADTAEVHLGRARIETDVVRLSRAVHEEAQATVATPERMRDAGPRWSGDDRATPDAVFRDAVLFPEQE